MKLASIQLEIDDRETKQERMNRVDVILSGLSGYDLILLPEIWATGYFSFDHYIDEAEPMDGFFVRHYAQKAKELHANLFAGSFIESKGEHFFNTSVLLDRNGKLTGSYRKIHLFRYGSAEGDLLSGGTRSVVVPTDFGKVGLSTCYDLRFPELYRKELDRGATIFLVTSAWPLRRLDHWKLLNQARALENQCYLLSCNSSGRTQGVLLGGHSRVVDPWGTVLASAGEAATVLTAEIDLAKVAAVRAEFPQLRHRVHFD
ncbi:MAG: carbon-nitrogen family hydrolase [Sporolactobacillus sp.]|jgi:predicted amidohydrolase|nr:carbon-nitrogen family hydrolase [Sporolactobacillus sp.]